MPLVAALLGHHIDGSAQKSTLSHIKRRNAYRHLFYRIKRQRVASCRQARTNAECIIERRSVHRHRRTAVIAATHSKTSARGCPLRGQPHDVVQAAAHGGHGHECPIVYMGGNTRVLHIHARIGCIVAYHHHIERSG